MNSKINSKINTKINTKYKILTPDGFKDFSKVNVKEKDESVLFKFSNKRELGCSYNHKIDTKDGYKYARELEVGDYVLSKNNETKIINKIHKPGKIKLFDLVDVDDFRNRFIANDIIVSNCAFIRPNVFQELWDSMYPSISSSKKSKIMLVSTSNGHNHFYYIWRDAILKKNRFRPLEINWFENEKYCKDDGIFRRYSGDELFDFKKIDSEDSFQMSISEMKERLKIESKEEDNDVYLVQEVRYDENGNELEIKFERFWGIFKHKYTEDEYDFIDYDWYDETIDNKTKNSFDQEFGNKFLAAGKALVGAQYLTRLVLADRLKLKDFEIYDQCKVIHDLLDDYVHVYFEPEKDIEYFIGVDFASVDEENDGDNFSLQVLGLYPMNSYKILKQVLTINISYGIQYIFFPAIIDMVGRWYNEGYIFAENNDQTAMYVLNKLKDVYEYEYIYAEKPKMEGIRTTTKTKKIGTLNLKLLIEKGKLEINDPTTLSELSTFIKKKNSYSAEIGCKDDSVMAMIAAIFFLQDYTMFSDQTDDLKLEKDFTTILKEERKLLMEKEEEYEEPSSFFASENDEVEESVW